MASSTSPVSQPYLYSSDIRLDYLVRAASPPSSSFIANLTSSYPIYAAPPALASNRNAVFGQFTLFIWWPADVEGYYLPLDEVDQQPLDKAS